jgi:hypothetical protein
MTRKHPRRRWFDRTAMLYLALAIVGFGAAVALALCSR